MKYLVTGCAGFIGSHLSEALVDAGHSVVGIDCFADYYPKRIKLSNLRALKMSGEFNFIEADLASSGLSRVIKGVHAVFHLAAQPGVRASWGKTFSHYVRDNVVATQRLLEAVKAEPVKKFIYASSSSVYGDAEKMPTPEDATPIPVSPYGATKLAGEHLCHIYLRSHNVPVVKLRYFSVYGPRQRPDMAFSRFISAISSGKEIETYGDGTQKRDFTYVRDIVRGTMLALEAAPGATYNVGAGNAVQLNEVISELESIIGKKARIKRKDAALGDVRNTAADIARISRELGYKPATSLQQGLEEQVRAQLLTTK